MPTQTPNLNLEKPLGSEKYNINKLNANFDKIDEALGNLSSDASSVTIEDQNNYYLSTDVEGALSEVGYTLANLPTNTVTDINQLTDESGLIPSDISDLTDTTGIIPSDVSDLSDTSNLIPSDYEKTIWNAKANKSTELALTLSTASWAGTAAPFTYALTVTGVTVDSNQELVPSTDITQTQLEALQAANVQDAGQASNIINLKAWGEKPSVDIPIRVILRGDA